MTDIFKDRKIEFPVVMVLRIILLAGGDESDHIPRIEAILDGLNIPHEKAHREEAGSGKYYKLKIQITLTDEDRFKALYSRLGTLDFIKAVL